MAIVNAYHNVLSLQNMLTLSRGHALVSAMCWKGIMVIRTIEDAILLVQPVGGIQSQQNAQKDAHKIQLKCLVITLQ